MGKKVCFFITEKDAIDLIEIIKFYGGVKFDTEKNDLQKNNKFFFKLPDSVLVYASYNGEKNLNQIESEIIEFSLSKPQSPQVLDVSSVEEHFRKGEFIVVDDSDKFRSLMDELQKNPIYIDNPNYIPNGYECGRIWFEPKYYDINGIKKSKNKKLTSLFSAIKRYVQKNYVLATNKNYYIGPDAFQKYIDGEFIPCSGSSIIEFPYQSGDGSLCSSD